MARISHQPSENPTVSRITRPTLGAKKTVEESSVLWRNMPVAAGDAVLRGRSVASDRARRQQPNTFDANGLAKFVSRIVAE